MEFHQLRYFVAAAEDQNISHAAARLHVSQPAMSRQIGLLEEELGTLLFDRIRKRIHLTDAGRFFLGKARQLLCDAETGAQQVREQFGGQSKTLRLGFISPFLDDLVAPAVREFRQRHANTRVSLFDLPPRAQMERLRLHELDAVILGNLEDLDRGDFEVVQLSRHKMAAVLPEDHALAKKSSIKLAALKDEEWVSLSNAFFPGRREFLEETCRRANFAPRLAAELDTLPMMLAAVATGAGVGILPWHARKIPHAGCVFLSLTAPTVNTELLLVRPKGHVAKELETLVALLAERARGLGDT